MDLNGPTIVHAPSGRPSSGPQALACEVAYPRARFACSPLRASARQSMQARDFCSPISPVYLRQVLGTTSLFHGGPSLNESAYRPSVSAALVAAWCGETGIGW